MRRRIITALVAGTAAALLAACGPLAEDAAAPATSAPATPQEKLAAAVPDGTEGRYAFALKDGESTTKGVVDAKAKRSTLTVTYKEPEVGFTMTMSYLLVEADQWVKITFDKQLPGMPKLPKKWLLIDKSKVDDGAPVSPADPDPVGAGDLVDAIVEVKESKPGTFTGTVDLTKADKAAIVDEEGLAALGGKAKAVPFTATVDDAGRLASIDIKVPAHGEVKAATHHATFSAYGSAPEVSAPSAGASQPAPAAAYELLNA
ncbi:hypothetical protein O7635_01880 [Asanoa sp. WMMD1127]|uniref:hypothetical protein n=1 Tax=Asanoa sp. WMMD1127 TaxID=3016107 RepID=UPI002417BC30|nr:hypothetical protein [Asanoa sp. WMMD1127]MDG4820600.1 hypothetical protein [Asanoa sp. WMMD1127]